MKFSLKFNYIRNTGLFKKLNKYTAKVGDYEIEGESKTELADKTRKFIKTVVKNQGMTVYSYKGFVLVVSPFYDTFEYTITTPSDSGCIHSRTIGDDIFKSAFSHFRNTIIDETDETLETLPEWLRDN